MAGIGDLGGDGINDIAVGAFFDDDGGTDRGAVYVLHLAAANNPPTDIGLAPATVAESVPIGTVVGTLSTTDPDPGDTHTYALVAGVGDGDNALFTVVGDQLQTAAALDFETLGSPLNIRVETTDSGTGNLTFEEAMTVTLTDVNEAPTDIGLAPSTVAENVPIGTVVGTFTTTDPDPADTHTYALVIGVGDGDNALFTIVGDQLQTAVALDFETLGSPLNIRVETTDSGVGNLTYEEAMTVTLTDQNEAPTDIGLAPSTVAENVPIGTVVGTFTSTDPDPADTHTYALVAGVGDADNGLFTVVGDQLQTAVLMDYEALGAVLNIRVETTDSGTGNLTYEEAMTVTLTDQNEAPTDIGLAPSTVAENVPIGTVVGTLSTTDPDPADTHTYALVAGVGDADNGLFTIVGDQLQTAVLMDYEALGAVLNIRVETTDSGTGNLTYEEAMTVTLTDVNEAPTDIGLAPSTVAENVPIGTVVGTFTTTDPDPGDTHTYALVVGVGDGDNGLFTVVGDQLQTSRNPTPLRFDV